MSMHSETGPNPPKLLPLTDPRCNNDSCTAFQAAHNLSQATVSYTWQFEYGHWTTWYFAILVFIFALANISRVLHSRTVSQLGTTSGLQTTYSKSVAAARYLTYRRARGKIFDWLGLPSLGVLALLLLSVLFICILTFAIRPYYRQHRGFGSPPLAIRAGLMAAACTPILVAISGKVNFISLLTGIGHERLNLFHRWVGWICLGLSIVHTIPFIVAPVKDGGPAALHAQYYTKGAFEYTGAPALAILVGLTVFSIPIIRRRFYESFYILHILLYVTYLGLCFWHFGQEGDSWAYLWATLAIFLASLLGRIFWFNRAFNIKGRWIVASRVEIVRMPGQVTKLIVWPMPTGFNWRPGQHCFLRFPGLEALGNHPFTIASADLEKHPLEKKRRNTGIGHNASTLTFYVRTHDGFTRKLADCVARSPEASGFVWIEGSYGGISHRIENSYDSIVLVAGGGGVTTCLPWAEFLMNKHTKGEKMKTRALKFVWIVRESAHLSWISKRLPELVSVTGPNPFLDSQLFVTNQGCADNITLNKEIHGKTMNLSGLPEGVAKDGKMKRVIDVDHRKTLMECINGQPRMKDVRPGLIHQRGKTLVLGCGPESLKIDLSNACADLQTSVMKGQVGELALHTETFGW